MFRFRRFYPSLVFSVPDQFGFGGHPPTELPRADPVPLRRKDSRIHAHELIKTFQVKTSEGVASSHPTPCKLDDSRHIPQIEGLSSVHSTGMHLRCFLGGITAAGNRAEGLTGLVGRKQWFSFTFFVLSLSRNLFFPSRQRSCVSLHGGVQFSGPLPSPLLPAFAENRDSWRKKSRKPFPSKGNHWSHIAFCAVIGSRSNEVNDGGSS